jgi:TonB family protein
MQKINKTKITFAVISALLHLYLVTTFSLTKMLHPPVKDIWSKPPRAASYTMVMTYPVTADKKINDANIKRDDKIQKYKTHLKPDFTKRINPVLRRPHFISKLERRVVSEKRTVRPIPTNKHEVFLDQTTVVPILVPLQKVPSSDRTAVVTKLSVDNDSLPRPRIKNITNSKFMSGNHRANELQRYTKMIKDKIANNTIYPPLARRRGIEGVVLVAFLITNKGLLRDIRLIDPSEYEILNRAAITTINSASPFLPFPESVDKKELWLKLALSFKLDQ